MSLGPGWRRLFRLSVRTQRSMRVDIDDELAFHLSMREETLERRGLSPSSAQRAALVRFGDPDVVRTECLAIDSQFAREARMTEWFESLLADLRFAARTLLRTPVFAVVATLTLALGVAASSAIFSLVDGILLRPLPYPDAGRLVRVVQSFPEKGLDNWPLSQENLAMYRDGASDFQSFGGYWVRGTTIQSDGQPKRIVGVQVTGDFFTVLGVQPMLGRAISRVDDHPNPTAVVVLGNGFWQTHFAGDPNVLGKTIDLYGTPTRVIGVMPPGFAFPDPTVQVYRPLGLDPSKRFGWFIRGVGRLKPGVSAEHARAQTTALLWTWARNSPNLLGLRVDPRATHLQTIVTPLHDAITGETARPLAVLQAAVIVILLIAVGNVAMLFSSRAAGRSREVAVRSALGATRGRVMRQLLTESIVLAVAGGLVGIVLAAALVRAFTHSSIAILPRITEVGVSWRVATFTLAVSVASGLLFGLAPAIHLPRRRLADALSGSTQSARSSARRLNGSLVVAQLALSVMLLVSAGLVIKSFRRLLGTDLGFTPSKVTSILLPLPPQRYGSRTAVPPLTEQLVRRVSALPGVGATAVVWSPPFSGSVNTDGYLIEGHAPPADAGSETQTVTISATPGYFNAVGIPLRYGRDVSWDDRANGLPVVVVDEALASRYWVGADAIGKRMRLTGDTTWLTIVGVVGSIRDEDVATVPRPHSYFPYAQQPSSSPSLVVRTRGDASPVVGAVRRVISELEPSVPLDGVRSLSESIDVVLRTRRLTEALLLGFALLAATLAAVGVYGVMSLYVTNRHREFGIRLAIGASPRNLVRRVLGEGSVLGMLGVLMGTGGALLGTRWLGTLLYQVSPTDPEVFVGLAFGLLAVAVTASYLPARRAARSDPLIALRSE
jgi:predicted permease